MIAPRLAAALGLGLGLLALPAGAQSVDGIYDGISCDGEIRSELSIAITWPTIEFYESTCQIVGATPIPGLGGINLYQAQCSGEGAQFDRTYVITPDFDGGLIVVGEGYAQSYDRCGG